jgi:predicted phosphate transport protein (TIGR00153 family)
MLTILRLFGRSPFAPLETHMESVAKCVHKLPALFQALEENNYSVLEQIAEEISELEHKADLIKIDIRNRLTKSLILPIDRGNLLQILSLQDGIADKVEDVAVLFTVYPLKLLPVFQQNFRVFVDKTLETFDGARLIMKELHELIESSFGGIEAEKVKNMVDQVAFKEHEADLIQRNLLKDFFKAEKELTFITFHQWQKIFENLATISNLSENLAYRVRMTLELK